jgi:hypothetical protein
MTHKVITLEFVVPTLLAIALGIVLSIGAVQLIDSYLGPIDQASHHAGFVQAIAPPEQSAGSTLRVLRSAELTTPPSVQLRNLDGLL